MPEGIKNECQNRPAPEGLGPIVVVVVEVSAGRQEKGWGLTGRWGGLGGGGWGARWKIRSVWSDIGSGSDVRFDETAPGNLFAREGVTGRAATEMRLQVVSE